jgi:hypothetical protein
MPQKKPIASNARQPVLVLVIKAALAIVLGVNVLLLGVFVGGILGGMFGGVMQQSPLMFQDFTRYYTFGAIAASSQRSHLYDRAVQHAREVQVLSPYYHGDLPASYNTWIDYTPPMAVLMVPAASLPLPYSLLSCEAVAVLTGAFGIHLLRGKGWRDTLLFVAGVAASIFSWRALAIGQLTWLIFGLASLYFYWWWQGKNVICGILIALIAVPKLQYAIFFVIPLLVSRNWRALSAAALTMATLIALSASVIGWPPIKQYPALVMHTQTTDPGTLSMISLRSLTDLILHRPLSTMVAELIFVAGIVATFAVWFKAWNADERSRNWAIALTVCLALICNFHAHNYDSLLLSVAAARTMPTLDMFAIPTVKDAGVRRWTAVFLALPVASWMIMRIPDSLETLRCVIVVLVATGITALAALEFIRAIGKSRTAAVS